jgi:hypothetical protein
MKIDVYFTHSFLNDESEMYKIKGQGDSAEIDYTTKITVSQMYKDGWKLAHAVKTSQSAQLESFNFLLIFEK